MFSNTKIALSVAIALGSAFASLTTCAFAGNVYDSPDWAPPFFASDIHRHSAAASFESNAHGSTPGARKQLNATRQPNATRRSY
jgi:hypothetical protein